MNIKATIIQGDGESAAADVAIAVDGTVLGEATMSRDPDGVYRWCGMLRAPWVEPAVLAWLDALDGPASLAAIAQIEQAVAVAVRHLTKEAEVRAREWRANAFRLLGHDWDWDGTNAGLRRELKRRAQSYSLAASAAL